MDAVDERSKVLAVKMQVIGIEPLLHLPLLHHRILHHQAAYL
jgi:hypothetical protein